MRLLLLKETHPARSDPSSVRNALQTPIENSKSDSVIMQPKPSIPVKKVKSDTSAVLMQPNKESMPATPPKPDIANLPQQGSVPLRPSLPFSVITVSREELLQYMQQSQSVKRPPEVNSNCVVQVMPMQEPAGKPGPRVKLQYVHHVLNETPVGQLVGQDGKQTGYLIPTEANEVEVPKAMIVRSQTPEGSLQQYSVYLPLKDSAVCSTKSIC